MDAKHLQYEAAKLKREAKRKHDEAINAAGGASTFARAGDYGKVEDEQAKASALAEEAEKLEVEAHTVEEAAHHLEDEARKIDDEIARKNREHEREIKELKKKKDEFTGGASLF